jgi:hypothetical protein
MIEGCDGCASAPESEPQDSFLAFALLFLNHRSLLTCFLMLAPLRAPVAILFDSSALEAVLLSVPAGLSLDAVPARRVAAPPSIPTGRLCRLAQASLGMSML